jgi:hypothetical protein
MAYSGTCGMNGDNLRWVLDDNGVLTISGTDEMVNWSNGSSVPWYYNRSHITTIKIEEGVTSIGDYAFQGCSSLTSVDLPDSLEIIGATAFRDCERLTSITIPKGVTTIGNHAFGYCNELTEIIIPDNVISIGEQIFYGCRKLKNAMIGNGLKSIGNYAFYDCISLTSITIGTNIETIGAQAFYNCYGLTQIVIPDSVVNINNHAFYYCSNLTSITIPDSVKYINNNAFNNCKSLEIATIGNGVKNIDQGVFYNCTNLISIEIPESVETIGQNAFYNCTNLSNVYYGGSRSQWNNIDINSSGNTELIANAVTFYFYKGECGSNLNYEFDRVDTLIIRGTGEMYNYNINSLPLWDGYKEKIKEIIVKEGVLSIGKLAFSNCTNATSVSIENNSVVSINEYAFTKCTNLNNIEISDSVKTINDNAFSDCNNLSTVDYKGTQKQWNNVVVGSNNEPLIQANIIFLEYKGSCGENLTYEFDGIDTLTIVGEGDMYDYTETSLSPWSEHKENIKIVILPEFITKIGNYAFFNCDNLATVNYKGSQIEWDNVNKGSNNDSLTQANITFFEIKLSHYLTEDTDLTTLIDLIDYANAKSQEGYKFVVYYSSAEEKKKIIKFKIDTNKEFETCYIGEKGKLNINFNKVESCELGEKIFVNRKIDFLDIPYRDGNGVFKMAKGTLTDSIINQLSIPYIGGNSQGSITENGKSIDCDYFSWLYGEDKFVHPEEAVETTVDKGSPLKNLPNTVIINSIDTIPNFAFSWCDIKNIELPTGLTTVGDYAFYQTGMSSLNIPKGLKTIGEYAFYTEILKKINWISNIPTLNSNSIGVGEDAFYVNKIEEEIIDKNIVKNGDFSDTTNVTNYWEINNNYTPTKIDDYLNIKATGNVTTEGNTFPCYQNFNTNISGNTIIYACAKIKSPNTNVNSYPRVYLSYYKNGLTGDDNIKFQILESIDGNSNKDLNDDSWHTLSTRVSTYADTGDYYTYQRIAFGLWNTTVNEQMNIKDIRLFNLTEIFGRGYEPTKTWCDNNLTKEEVIKSLMNYPEVNGVKFLSDKGTKVNISEGSSDYNFNYTDGIVTDKSENIKAYFSLPYYIFTAKLNNNLQNSCFVEQNGSCGDNLEYYLTDVDSGKYVLNISGSGDMDDFTEYNVPWKTYLSDIEKIKFSEKISSIGTYAFNNCTALTETVLPINLNTIRDNAFYNCENLEKVVVNNNLKKIGISAFKNCKKLKEFNFNDKIEQIGDYAFYNCGLNLIDLKGEKLNLGTKSFACNTKLIEVEISQAIFIGEGSFAFCSKLSKIKLPFVGETANATNEQSILGHTIGGVIAEISENDNLSLYYKETQVYTDGKTKEFYIPKSLKEIYILGGDVRLGALSGLSNIDKIVFEDNINSIQTNALWGIDNLRELKVPYKTFSNTTSYFYDIDKNWSVFSTSYNRWSVSNFNFIERLFNCNPAGNQDNANYGGIYARRGIVFPVHLEVRTNSDYSRTAYIQLPKCLNKITITKGNLSQIGQFSQWKHNDLNLENLEFIDNTETTIPEKYFRASKINNINTNVIPISYGQYAFSKAIVNSINNLNWLKLFENFTSKISVRAFESYDFEKQEINKLIINNCTIENYAFDNIKLNSVEIKGNSSLGTYCFNNSTIKEININTTETIGEYAFNNCTELEVLNIVNCKYIGAHILSGCSNIITIVTPFVGSSANNSTAIDGRNWSNSFYNWLSYVKNTYTGENENYYNYKSGPYSSGARCSQKLNNFQKLILTNKINLISDKFYDMGRWFPNLKIYFTAQTKPAQIATSVFAVHPTTGGINTPLTYTTIDKYYYFKGEYDESEIAPYLTSPAGAKMRNLKMSINNSTILSNSSEQQRVIKLLNNKDYSWKALLYGKDYDVYITDNNTYSESTSDLPILYLPNNSKMEKGQQINLIGEDTYKIKELEDFSYSNKIFYRQSKGVVSGKLNYFNTVTGYVSYNNENWEIIDENFKGSLTSDFVNFTIGSTYDSNHIDGRIKIEDDVITIDKLGTEILKGDTITIEKAKVTKGSIDASLLNIIKENSKFTTSTDGQLQTIKSKENYEIIFTPGFYIGTNGYNSVTITVADTELILPNDLLSNTVLLSVDTQSELLLIGATGDRVKKGIIDKKLIGIIKKGITSFELKDKKYIIKDINKEINQIIFETKEQEGYMMDSSESTFTIQLENYIDFASEKEEEKFNLTDLHLTLNHINIFKVTDIKKYDKLNESSVLKDGEILYLITTKEVINSTDYEVSERAIEKEFTLERYSTIATVETIDGSNVQHLLVHPDTYYQINSNYIETPQYYFQTTEEQDISFYVNNDKVVADIVGNLETNIYSSSANIKANYNGNLIWYKWNIQEEIEGQYYTIKELTEYYNPNIDLTYDLFRDGRTYRLMLTINTKENLQVVKYLYLNVQYEIDFLNNIIVDKDCKKKAIKISFLKNKNLFLFDNFEEKGNYSGIEHIYIENENKKLYKYIGEDEYLFYKENIDYIKDYAFSYELAQVANVAIRFYNSDDENVSAQNTNVIVNGVYDETLEAVILQGTNEMIIPYQENTSISYFHIGFYAPQSAYFSSLQLEEGNKVTSYEEPIPSLVNLTSNRIMGYIILREEMGDEDTLCKLAEINNEATVFYDYSFNREVTYEYYVVPIYFDLSVNKQVYGAPHKINNPINYNLKEVTLIDTIVDISPTETNTNFNIFLANTEEFAIWHLKYNTEAKNINIVTDKTVYETPMKIPTVNKTNRNYKTGTIKAFLGGFVRENNKLTYRDSIKLQNKFQDFCDNGRVKMLRDEIGNVIPVDVTLKSFDYNPHTVPTNITITFDWTQVGEEKDLSVWSCE